MSATEPAREGALYFDACPSPTHATSLRCSSALSRDARGESRFAGEIRSRRPAGPGTANGWERRDRRSGARASNRDLRRVRPTLAATRVASSSDPVRTVLAGRRSGRSPRARTKSIAFAQGLRASMAGLRAGLPTAAVQRSGPVLRPGPPSLARRDVALAPSMCGAYRLPPILARPPRGRCAGPSHAETGIRTATYSGESSADGNP
jgi:hypothetical protein